VAQQAELDERTVWQGLSAAAYDDAVYGSALLRSVFDVELRVARELLTPGSMLIEVGCGTGQFCRRLLDEAAVVVGVDISAGMLDELAARVGHRVVLVKGDACRLVQLLEGTPGLTARMKRQTPIVAACVMNTLGIMSDATRRSVLEQMAVTVGPNGCAFVVVFDRRHFVRGVEEFYGANPALCGDLEDATVDLAAGELTVHSTGYHTHWFLPEELRHLALGAGLRNITIASEGVGLILVANGC
jgi:SAM-dependent methyltransferase